MVFPPFLIFLTLMFLLKPMICFKGGSFECLCQLVASKLLVLKGLRSQQHKLGVSHKLVIEKTLIWAVTISTALTSHPLPITWCTRLKKRFGVNWVWFQHAASDWTEEIPKELILACKFVSEDLIAQLCLRIVQWLEGLAIWVFLLCTKEHHPSISKTWIKKNCRTTLYDREIINNGVTNVVLSGLLLVVTA